MRHVRVESQRTVPIVGDGAIGDPRILGGRLFPVLILDCSKHQPLEDLILAHKSTPPGDVNSSWSWRPFSRRHVYLNFEFKLPVETKATLAFEVASQGGLVEWIINARGVYLQPLSSGARVSEGMTSPKIIVEVPQTSTFPIWKRLHRNTLEKQYKRRGLSSAQAREAVDQHLERMHEIQFRKHGQPSRDVSA
jgi:hypothetical protein